MKNRFLQILVFLCIATFIATPALAWEVPGGWDNFSRALRIIPDGTSTAPAWAFQTEQTLGFYRSASGVISLVGGNLSLGTSELLLDSLKLNDSDDSHYLEILTNSNLTADRILTLTPGDAARTITLSGNPTLADWFDQAVKTSSTPTFASQILSGNWYQAASSYHNWDATLGTSGYGLRDNAGSLQFKNSGGSWADLVSAVTAGGWQDDGTVVRLITGTDNVGVGGATAGGTALASGVVFGQWTEPTTSPADVAQIGAADYQSAAGYTRLHQRTETNIVSALALNSEVDVLSNPRQPSQAVNMTAAASGSTGISRADNDNVDFGTGDFTLAWKGSVPDWTPSATLVLVQKTDGTNGWNLQVLTTGILRLTINTTNYDSTVAPQIVDGMVANIGVSVTRETASVAGSVVFYFNGYPLGTSVTIIAGAPTTVNNAVLLYVLGTSAVRTAGQAYMFTPYNRALSVAQHLLAFRNGVDFADKWGTQTAVYTSDFSAGADSWTASSGAVAGNIDAVGGEDNWLRYTVNTSNSTHYAIGPASTQSTYQKRYRVTLTYFIPSSNSHLDQIQISSDSGYGDAFIVSTLDAVTSATMEFLDASVAGTGELHLYAFDGGAATFQDAAGDDVFYVKDIIVTEIGATLTLEPEGIQLDKWYDSSNNGLDASYPAAGASLVRQPTKRLKQPAPTAKTTTTTLTIAELLTGILTGTHAAGATQTYTLPTGTLVDAAGQFGIDSYFHWSLINLSAAAADTITVAAGETHTVVGNMIVQSAHATTGELYGNSATFLTRKTAANTFVTYRIQ